MITVDSVRQRYGVTEATVLGWIKSGELRAVNVGRRLGAKRPRWRISQDAIDAFEASRTPTPTPPNQRKTRRRTSADIIEFYPTK